MMTQNARCVWSRDSLSSLLPILLNGLKNQGRVKLRERQRDIRTRDDIIARLVVTRRVIKCQNGPR